MDFDSAQDRTHRRIGTPACVLRCAVGALLSFAPSVCSLPLCCCASRSTALPRRSPPIGGRPRAFSEATRRRAVRVTAPAQRSAPRSLPSTLTRHCETALEHSDDTAAEAATRGERANGSEADPARTAHLPTRQRSRTAQRRVRVRSTGAHSSVGVAGVMSPDSPAWAAGRDPLPCADKHSTGIGREPLDL